MLTHVTARTELESLADELYQQCRENAPNFGVDNETFKTSIRKTADKYLFSNSETELNIEQCREFLAQIQIHDLFMAIACSHGNERAWWEFDQQHRGYLERVAHHLARTEIDAQEVVDTVYVELYGTRVVDGERVSKFASYSGRGSIRGWLRTVIWHSLVDLHRASHDQVSLDEMTENIGEGMTQASFAEPAPGGEDEMIDHLKIERYRKATVTSLRAAFKNLEDHEKLLLLYYHVENLKLREIAHLVEDPSSSLRDWFQRRSAARENNSSRTHESTVMRWLEKSYARVLLLFRQELENSHHLGSQEIDICLELAQKDLSGNDIFQELKAV